MIRLDEDYTLKSDTNSWTLCRRRIVQSGDNAGKEYFEEVGYYGIPEQAIERWYREMQKETDADDLATLVRVSERLSRKVSDSLARKKP